MNTGLMQGLGELAVVVVGAAGFVVVIYAFVLLRWYRPKNGAKHFQLKLGQFMVWVDAHPFVPLPAALAVLLLAVGGLVPSLVARIVLASAALLCVLVAVRIAMREPWWTEAARRYFDSPASYVAGRAERLEWAAAGVMIAWLAAGYMIVAGATTATWTALAIVFGVVLIQVGRRRSSPRR